MNTHSRSLGFTVVELLVVIAIILVLVSILLPAIGMARERARIAATQLKMRNILEAFQGLSRTEADAALTIQERAGLGGVLRYRPLHTSESVAVANNALTFLVGTPRVAEGTWFTQEDYDQPHIFGFPWERPDRIQATQLTSPLTITGPLETAPLDAEGIQMVSCSGLSPERSHHLLAACGILQPIGGRSAQEGYFTDRSSTRGWNDAWGNPLLVAYGIFQPGPANLVGGGDLDGLRVSTARRAYGYARAIYLSVGAVGPHLPETLSATDLTVDDEISWQTTVLPSLWQQVTSIAGGDAWTGSSFANPPWTGIKAAKLGNARGLLSAPIDIR